MPSQAQNQLVYSKKNNMVNNPFQATKNRLKAYFNYIGIFLAVLLLISLWRNIGNIRESTSLIDKKEKELAALAKKNKDLKENLEKVKSEDYIERQIRDELGLAKEGEVVLVMPEPEILKSLVPSLPREEVELPDPNWRKWMKLFF